MARRVGQGVLAIQARPDLIVANPQGGTDPGKPRLLIQVYPRGQGLDSSVADKHWKASPWRMPIAKESIFMFREGKPPTGTGIPAFMPALPP